MPPRPPLLLVDVDGVISVFGPSQTDPSKNPDDLLSTLVEGIPHALSRRAAAHLAALAQTFECVWCTGWEERADTHLPHLLGLPGGWPHLTFPDPPAMDAHWKLRAIDAHAGPDRPLAWIDDAHDARCAAWAAARPGPTLLLTTHPAVGLTDEHVERLRRWAEEL